MGERRGPRLAASVLVLVAGCSGNPESRAGRAPSPPVSPTPVLTPSPTPAPSVTGSPARSLPATARPAAARPTGTWTSPPASPAPRRTAAALPACPRVPQVRTDQVVLVDSSGSSAVVRACQRRGDRWVSVLGRMHGHVGFRGVAAPGAKREGDRRTPGGVFTLGLGFGTRADPGGTWFGWRRATRADVWVDDPQSDLYNTWQTLPANGRWDSAESLYQPVDYAYAQVIDYNTARVPGRGSAIFLHVDDGNPTLGCVTVPRPQLVRLFRWQRPGVVMVIR